MSILLPTNKGGHIVLPFYAFNVERLLKSPKSTLNAPVLKREAERVTESER